MALQKCGECGHMVSALADRCPNCGAPVRRVDVKVSPAFVIIILVAVGMAAYIHFSTLPEPQNEPSTATKDKSSLTMEPIRISAEDLWKEYSANEVAADSKFKGRQVIASGKVDKIGKDLLGKAYVTLQAGDGFGRIQCFFGNQNVLVRLGKDDQITVKCEAEGKMGNVVLKKCSMMR